MGTLWQDLRYGVRMLLKKPGFTAVAVLALALGIGANTAIFSVVNAVLLRPLPFKDPDQILMLWEATPFLPTEKRTPVSPANFVDWKERNQVFEHIAAFYPSGANLVGGSEPERIRVAYVTPDFFPLLGVQPAIGRAFIPEEGIPGNEQVLLLSHGLWQRRFGGDPEILGKTVTLNTKVYKVIGIMPQDFRFPMLRDAETWAPMALDAGDLASRGSHWLRVVARPRPGVTSAQVQADLDSIARGLEQQYPDTNKDRGIEMVPLQTDVVTPIRPTVLVLLGAVGFVLLIACANVANLLLARAATRQKEIAIRTTLGASRLRLIRQLLTESLLLALIGGGLGILVAYWGVDLLVALAPQDMPRFSEIALDRQVLGFTLIVSLLTGVVFGLAPALQSTKPNLNESLKEGGRSATSSPRHQRLRNLLVAAEVALALVLLIGAGLMIKSVQRLQHTDPGFETKNLLTMQVSLPRAKYKELRQQADFFERLLDRLKQTPGMEQAAIITLLPLTGNDFNNGFHIDGRPLPRGESHLAYLRLISPNYFDVLGLPLLKGRQFTEQDSDKAPPVVIINEALARKFFPGEDPLGKRLVIEYSHGDDPPAAREIVGIIRDLRESNLDAEAEPQTYLPFQQEPNTFMSLVVRAPGEPAAMAATVQREVRALDQDVPVHLVRSMEQVVAEAVAPRRFSMFLLGGFAAIALVLALVGIYGVMSYSVAQRTHEIGIRMALGAQSSDVLKMVVGQGMVIALFGICLGLVGAFALTRLMSSLLYGVSATDPWTFIGIALLLSAVALLASYLPARKAMKVDPMVALRYE